MATGGQRRTRSERVAALELPPGQWERAWIGLRRRDVIGRIALAFAAAVAVCTIIRAWDPPMPWRLGVAPPRYVTARVAFEVPDTSATDVARAEAGRDAKAAREKARGEAKFVFANDSQPLVRLRAILRTTIADLTKAETLNDASRAQWREFLPAAEKVPAAMKRPPPKSPAAKAEAEKAAQQELADFREFRKALGSKESLDQLDAVMADAFAPLERHGILAEPTEALKGGNQKKILVYPVDKQAVREEVEVSDVVFDKDKAEALRRKLEEELHAKDIGDHIFAWLEFRLFHIKNLSTLTKNDTASLESQREAEAKLPTPDEAAAGVPAVFKQFSAGDTLVKPGEKIDDDKRKWLKGEYQAFIDSRPLLQRVARGAAMLAVVFAMFIICGMYMRYRQRGPLASLGRLTGMLTLAVATVALAQWLSFDTWRAEPLPLILFGMTMAIAYRQELALLLSGVLAWIIVLAVGHGLPAYLLMFGTTAAAALNMGRIRSRSKLIYVGLFAGGVAALLDIAVSMIDDQPLGLPLLQDALWQGLWALAAGFIMTGVLPFIEKLFNVLTDLSLLELGDITHPLLQELVRRAPSTYNHSLTIGSIGEAAADAIGARGLLVRVGAYFHDIGKMLKPGYFVENQGKDGSRHESLVPAMSTLVIIAHIKDGADLARQHRLPQPIIDMIQQHHGTMLMEYFYDRAHTQQDADPNGSEVDENLFRYPGPKPQTKEAAVLMLADAVESASRTLVDPTPARIESLVRDLAQRRLQGGQFDESGLTLRELGTIERSLVMSVASIYHGRLKYPEPRSA